MTGAKSEGGSFEKLNSLVDLAYVSMKNYQIEKLVLYLFVATFSYSQLCLTTSPI